MLRSILKLFQFILWVAMLPVRGALLLLSFLILGASSFGAIICRLLGALFMFVLIGGLIFPIGMSGSDRLVCIIAGSVFLSLPYIGCFISECVMAFAGFLGELTSPFNES